MNSLRKTFFALIFSALAFTTIDAQFQFGAGAVYNLDLEVIGVQGRALYGVTEQIDVMGGFTYYLDDVADYSLDVNVHYNLLTLGENIELAPIAGLNITRVSVLGFGASNTAIQAGAHFKIPAGNMTFYAEPKLIFDGSQFVISGGVLFGGDD